MTWHLSHRTGVQWARVLGSTALRWPCWSASSTTVHYLPFSLGSHWEPTSSAAQLARDQKLPESFVGQFVKIGVGLLTADGSRLALQNVAPLRPPLDRRRPRPLQL